MMSPTRSFIPLFVLRGTYAVLPQSAVLFGQANRKQRELRTGFRQLYDKFPHEPLRFCQFASCEELQQVKFLSG